MAEGLVLPYLDIPFQHADPCVLRRMARPAAAARTLDEIARWRSVCPDIALRSTFIVGYPGETDEQFETLLDFVAEMELDHVGVFTYSHEEGTRAFALADDVPARVKRKRRNTLMQRQRKIVASSQKAKVGREVEVLVDGPSPEHDLVLQGRLRGQAPEIDPVVFLTDCDPALIGSGDLIRARIVGARGYDLVAAPIG